MVEPLASDGPPYGYGRGMANRTTVVLKRAGDELPWKLDLHADLATVERWVQGETPFTVNTDLGMRTIKPADVVRIAS